MISTWGSAWGDEDTVAPTTQNAAPWEQYLQTGAQALAVGLEAYQDPFRRYELAKARLENARVRGAGPGRIRVLEAKVRAAQANLGIETAEEQSDREYRMLGKLAIVTGIAAGGALIVLLLSASGRVRRV